MLLLAFAVVLVGLGISQMDKEKNAGVAFLGFGLVFAELSGLMSGYIPWFTAACMAAGTIGGVAVFLTIGPDRDRQASYVFGGTAAVILAAAYLAPLLGRLAF